MVGAEKLPLLHLSCLIRTLAVEILWPCMTRTHAAEILRLMTRTHALEILRPMERTHAAEIVWPMEKKHMPHNYKLEPNYEI